MAKTAIQFDRIKNDTNGNPRYVTHFLEMLTKDENYSSFLSWAEVKYELAMYRSAPMGGKRFHNKSYGGGILFQSYNIEHQLSEAFPRFENSPRYQQAQTDMVLVVVNDFELYTKALEAMTKVYDKKLMAKSAFAELMHICRQAAAKYKKRVSHEAVFIAACYVVLALEEQFKDR